MCPPDSPPQITKPAVGEDSGHYNCAGGATSVQRKRNQMPSMCTCESCNRLLKSGYSLPIGYAALTGNGSSLLTPHSQQASTQLFTHLSTNKIYRVDTLSTNNVQLFKKYTWVIELNKAYINYV